ncbi:MAG TPA: hypothetical protein VFS08_18465 [Gemmatimonadaceae bacterium]|nr:hypothetical protein [Gemmatimonadaceae bacterium]
MVLYVPVTAAALRALNSIERGGEHALILAGHDDEPSRMRETIEFAARPIVTMQVLRRIEPQLRLLPAPLARGVRLMFAQPDAFKCIETLAEVAGLPRRTTDRLLAGSGLAPANRLRGVAKMCMVYRALSRSGLHGEIVAERLGYSSDRALHRHVERVTAYSPARLRRLPRMEVAVLLANRARRVSQPDDMADEESLIRDSA